MVFSSRPAYPSAQCVWHSDSVTAATVSELGAQKQLICMRANFNCDVRSGAQMVKLEEKLATLKAEMEELEDKLKDVKGAKGNVDGCVDWLLGAMCE